MSEFINQMFSEQGTDRKYVKEKMSAIPLEMSNACVEIQNTPKQLISFTFKALWRMKASGAAEEYDKIHKIAVQSLTRGVYEEFYTKLTNLELALYDHDVEKAKEIVQEIKKEIGI